MNQIFLGLTIALTINLLMFFPAYYWKTDKLTDISYSFTFIVLSTIMIIYHNTWIAGLMIIIRALRLWMYLLIRIMKIKRDNRFDKMRNDRKKFIQFWLLQGITVAIISIPLLLSSNNHISIIGIIIWGGWLLIEAIADYQKFQHIIYKRPKWIQNWLWKYSRHPNYFWEIICRIGVYITILPWLSLNNSLIAIISPLFIIVLLLFVSWIPLLEKSGIRKRGNDASYEEYVRITSILIPRFRKK